MKKFIVKYTIIISLVFVSFFSLPLLNTPVVQAQIKEPYKFQIKIPGLDSSLSIGEKGADNKIQSTLLSKYIVGVYNYSFAIAGILAAIILMGGGVLWLVSGNSPDKVGKAKTIIGNSLVGLVLLFSSNLILRTINPDLLAMKAITIEGIAGVGKKDSPDINTKCCSCQIMVKRPGGNNEWTIVNTYCKSGLELSEDELKKFCEEKAIEKKKEINNTAVEVGYNPIKIQAGHTCGDDKNKDECIPIPGASSGSGGGGGGAGGW